LPGGGNHSTQFKGDHGDKRRITPRMPLRKNQLYPNAKAVKKGDCPAELGIEQIFSPGSRLAKWL
jgi:hypothetical protein